MVIAEAMAAGCAVVASALPAFEYVAGSAARFVEPGDSAALTAQITELLGNPGDAHDLGRAAAGRVGRFDGSAVAAAFVSAYEDAVAAQSAV